MSGLKDQFKSVSPESLAELGQEPDPQDDIIDDVKLEDEDSPNGEINDPGETDDDDPSKGRTIDNVYGELSRKQEKFQSDMMSQMGNLVRDVTEKLNSPPAGQQGPRTVDDYSIAELTAYRDGLPAEDQQRPNLDSLIADKIVNEKVRQQVQEITGYDRLEAERGRAILQATERYPDLADEGSAFWGKVDSKIRSMSADYVNSNPRVVLDVANEVAIAEGVSPNRERTLVRVPGKPSANRADGSRPAPKDETKLKMTKDEAMKIAKKLENALGRKFTDEDIQRIREDHMDYDGYWSRSSRTAK